MLELQSLFILYLAIVLFTVGKSSEFLETRKVTKKNIHMKGLEGPLCILSTEKKKLLCVVKRTADPTLFMSASLPVWRLL